MILVTIVSFFTARITLQVLGVEDFGIQNVVMSVVSFIGIITGPLTAATQRFLAYDLGKNDIKHFQTTFSSILILFFIITISLASIAWSIGPWLIKTQLVIPQMRINAAIHTYFFVVVSLAASMMIVPFSSAIISYEKMGIFARLSVFESIIKLLVVYLLYICTTDKLVTLAFLNCLMQIILLFIYIFYCKHKLVGCNFKKVKDFKLYKELINFVGWNLFGYGAGMTCTIGINICLNIFFGPIINAAKGIADKLYQIVWQISNNFYMAVNPQIIKSYASKDTEDAKMLVCKSSKYAYFLVFIIALPIIIVMKEVLCIWLGKQYVTPEMIAFSQWIFIFSLVNTLEAPISQIIRATGNIRRYQICVGITSILVIPICYVFFKFGYKAIYSMVIWTIVFAIIHFLRIYIAKEQVGLPIYTYFKEVLMPIFLTTIPSAIIMWKISKEIQSTPLLRITIISLLSVVIILTCIITLGMKKNERQIIINKLKATLYK